MILETKYGTRPSRPARSPLWRWCRKNKTLLFAPCGKIGELSPRPSQVDLLEVVALVVLGLKGLGSGVIWLLGLVGRWGF